MTRRRETRSLDSLRQTRPTLDSRRGTALAPRSPMRQRVVVRILLSSVLAAEKSSDDITINTLAWYQQHPIRLRLGVRVTDVDPSAKRVTGSDGTITPYDTRSLIERSGPGVNAVVIGGGLIGRTTTAVLGQQRVEGVALSDVACIEADLVVVAAGIRPNVELAYKAGLYVNRGIVVNDHLETSDPDIFAVGECVEHRGVCYGLVAPLIEQAKVLAATVTGHKGPVYVGTVTASKLKIMGVDVFSAGDWSGQDSEPVRFEDRALGIYKKLTVRDGKLAGVILVGDTSDSHRYMEWLRTGQDLMPQRRHLLFPPPVSDAGLDIAQVADSATICGCVPFSQDEIRDIIRSQKLKAVQAVLDIYGNGLGCEVCKPALSYLIDVVWCGDHEEDRSARFINDRVHANIQKGGTFSVIPRIRGGVTSPDELRRIADVADKYHVPMVKISGSQRIDLLGIRKEDLPAVWADLGMPSGQAYTKGVRMVKTCVGTDFCRFGTQDSTAAGIEMERTFENLFTPHTVKMATVGCPRNCAEATVKDIGLVGFEGGWQVVVGGAAGRSVRKADLLVTVETTEGARQGLHERFRKSKNRSYDAWQEGRAPVNSTQFIRLTPIDQVVA